MRQSVVSFLVGLIFAIGLGISGMTQPAKVVGFLDFFGRWDPSLTFVMGGAIAAHLYFARRALKLPAPRLASRFVLPTRTDIDGRLLAGAAIFGLGWGIGGLCPGPALVSMFSGAKTTLAFVATMVATIAIYRRVVPQVSAPAAPVTAEAQEAVGVQRRRAPS